jgi:hypothetical protein
MKKIYNFLMYITILISITILITLLSLMNWNDFSKMIIPFSIIMSLPITAIIWISRQANTLFRKADSIEEQLNNLTTLDELINLHYNEFIPLSKKSFHQHTASRLKELHAIFKTKYQYLK